MKVSCEGKNKQEYKFTKIFFRKQPMLEGS